MEVDLVSAEQRLFRGEASAVFARSVEGEIGILPGHVPVLLELAPAPLAVQTEGGREVFAVHGGFLEYRGDRLTVLADGADRPSEIDASAAASDAQRFRDELDAARADGDDADRVRRLRRRVAVAEMRERVAAEHG